MARRTEASDVVEQELVALSVPVAVAEALQGVVEALRTDARFRDRVLLAVSQVQQERHRGPLTALVEALVEA